MTQESPNNLNKLIILDNKYCQLITDEKTFKKVRSFLSYKQIGVEYTAAYQNGWSGITYLINKKGMFYTGLFQKVKDFLSKNQISFTEEDRRKPKVLYPKIDLTKNLQKLGVAPYEHQINILNAAIKHQRGIVRACTGSGKTLATALITAEFNKPTVLYVIGLDLLDQFYKLFSELFDEEIGYVGNGTCKIKRITIASIWTIGRSLNIDVKDLIDDESPKEEDLSENNSEKIKKMLKDAKLHIFDESHVVTTNTISAIYKNIDPENIFGFSGTPFRDDNSDLLINSILGEQIINISASELISKGLLACPIIKFFPVPKIKVSSNYQSVYKDFIVENDIRNDLIVKATQDLLAKKYTPLVLFKQIKHGEILFEKMQEAGIKCEMLYGNDSLERRSEVKQALINKEIDVLLASTIFDIGIDIPILNSLVLSGGGRSNIRSLQRIGRVIRRYPGKKFAAVVDFYDPVKFLKNHSQIRYKTYLSEEGFKVIKCKGM